MRLHSNNLNEHFLSKHQLQHQLIVQNVYEHISPMIRPIGLCNDFYRESATWTILKILHRNREKSFPWIIVFHCSKFFVDAFAILSAVRSTISWNATQIISGVFWRPSSGWTKTEGKSPDRPSLVSPVHHSPFSLEVTMIVSPVENDKSSATSEW